MRWKFWKKATPAAQSAVTQSAEAAPGPAVTSQEPRPAFFSSDKKSRVRSIGRKKRHFEASCIAGADTGDEEFVFEGFERGNLQTTRRPSPGLVPPPLLPPLPLLQTQKSTESQARVSSSPSPPSSRKKGSHTLPRFLRRAASAGRKASSAAAASTAASSGTRAAAEKATTSSDEGFPSTSSGDLLSAEDDAPLGYCPHCRAVVQPLTMKKRSQIRTNPWVKERKRPRIDVVIKKSLDSGIYDGNRPGISKEVEATSTAQVETRFAETVEAGVQIDEDEAADATEVDEEQRSISLASRPEFDSSDSSTTDALASPVSLKRKVRRKRRRRQQSYLQQKQQPQHQWLQYSPYGSSDDDFAADAEVLAIHTAAIQPPSIVDEGIACMGYIAQQEQLTATAEVTPVSMSSEDSSSLWWDMDKHHLLLMLPPDTTSSSCSLNLTETAPRMTPVLHSETEFDSPPDTDSDSGSEIDFQPPGRPYIREGIVSYKAETEEESLADTVRRLAAQRDSLERRFREPPLPPQSREFDDSSSGFFARELERYRRELLFRALASVRDQLDCQMTRLERGCTAAVDQRVRQARENFLRQVSEPCAFTIGECGGGGSLVYADGFAALRSGERVTNH